MKSARTLTELAELNPTHFIADLKYDFERGLVTIVEEQVSHVRDDEVDSLAERMGEEEGLRALYGEIGDWL